MTASAMPRSSRARAAAVPASAPALPHPSPTFSKTCSAWPASAAAAAASAAPTCATTWRSRLEEAFQGKTAQIEIPVSVTCESCSGTGAKAGTKPKTCSHCGGAGRIRQAQGFFTLERTCPGCQGRGQMIEDACPSCSGSGRVTRERTLSVNIPQGVEDGTRIRLAGEGEAGVRGGPPGDLYIFLSLTPHQFFQRDGADLHCRVPISMVAAALGGEFEVPTIDKGKTQVKVPAGTQSGRRFRIASKGMPVLRSRQTGDMYVQVVVETPQNLTKKQQELLAEFEKLSSGATQPEAHGFLHQGQGLLRQGRKLKQARTA